MEIIRNPDGSLVVPIPEADITIATTQSKPRPVTALQRPLNRRLAYCIPVKVATARPSRNGIFNRILIAPPPSRLRVDEGSDEGRTRGR